MKEKVKVFLFILINLTWCLPQTLLGFLVWLYYKIRGCEESAGKYGTVLCHSEKMGGGISLGGFVITHKYENRLLKQRRLDDHEFGHTLQGFLLGPLYLIVIGIFSMSWNLLRRAGLFKKNDYYTFWTERWADKWGKVKR